MEEMETQGSLTAKDRVLIAQDVIATLRSRQRKIQLGSTYMTLWGNFPASGQMKTNQLRGNCEVCARGMLFLKSVDRFNHFDLGNEGKPDSFHVIDRSEGDWGDEQVRLIEEAFEGTLGRYATTEPQTQFHFAHGGRVDRKRCLIAIMQNIIDNGGTFRPETCLPAAQPAEARP